MYISNDNTRVILPTILAQEVLFKMLYWKDFEHFRYEMEEQLTSFQPKNWTHLVENMNMRTQCEYLTTDHFSDLYQQEESKIEEAVAHNADAGPPLGISTCFVRLFAFIEIPDATSTI